MTTPKILWYLFHPNISQSRGNKALFEAVKDLPNLTIVEGYNKFVDWKIDVPGEQKLLVEHDLVVFQHPFYWYSCPPLMKLWIDEVLTYNFAYPPKTGNKLHGKQWLSVITTGGAASVYQAGGVNNFTISEMMRPFQQSANLIGMKWNTPFVLHGVNPASPSAEELLAKGKELRALIETFDFTKRFSYEPLATAHYLEAIRTTLP